MDGVPTDVSSLHSTLPESEAVPEWVHLIPAGTFSGVDGRGPYHMPDAQAVIDASLKPGGKLAFDQDHSTAHSLKNGTPAPARGWIVAMQARADGIWGQVNWTDEGKRMLTSREYRCISPEFTHGRTSGIVGRLLRASLTNAPNLELTALHSQEDIRMDFIPAIRAALGLPETAAEPAIPAAAAAARTAVATHAQQIAAIATAAKLDPNLAPDAMVTALQSRKAEGGTLEEMVALQSQVLAMQTETKRTKAEAVIDAAMRAGKPIPAASREDFIARHMADPASTEFWLGTMTSLHSGGVPPGSPPEAASGLSQSDVHVIALMGMSPEAFLKSKEASAKGVAT